VIIVPDFNGLPFLSTQNDGENIVKYGYAINGFLKLYSQDGTELEKQWKLYNVFPENVDDISLDYAGNDSLKYSMTFSFDTWELV